MANQPFNHEEQQFLSSTGLDKLAAPAALPAARAARIASKARRKLALNAPAGATAPIRQPAAKRSTLRVPRWITAAAVGTAAAVTLTLVPLTGEPDIASAMEKAVADLHSYHGVVERQWLDQNGQTDRIKPERSELWEAGEKYRWITHNYNADDQIISNVWFVSDGDRQWGLDTRSKTVSVGPAIDSVRLRENLGVKELARLVLRNPHKVVGKETVAGRNAIKIEVTAQEGVPNYVWIDAETKLPLKAVEWMGTYGQKVITYAQLDINPKLDPSLFTVQVPEGYTLTEQPGRWVASLDEAERVAGFKPVAPGEQPRRIAAWEGNVAFVYEGAVLYQRSRTLKLWTAGNFVDGVGTAGGGPLLVANGGEHLQWHQNGIEMEINGPDPEKLHAIGRSVAPDFALPDPEADLVSQAKVKVEVGMEAARAIQADADERGESVLEHLSPANAAHAYLTEQFGTMPYEHDPYDNTDLSVPAMSVAEAVVAVPSGPVSRVYAKRVVSPKSHGAWFVVGYDPR